MAFESKEERDTALFVAQGYEGRARQNLSLLADPSGRWLPVLDTAGIESVAEPGAIGLIGTDAAKFRKIFKVDHKVVRRIDRTTHRVRSVALAAPPWEDRSDPALALLADSADAVPIENEFVVTGVDLPVSVPGMPFKTDGVFEVLAPDQYPAGIESSERLVLRRIVPPNEVWLP